MSKHTARDLFDRITGKRQALATAQAELAELERQAKWAEGEERRHRLEQLADEARHLSDHTNDTMAAITNAAEQVTNAIRNLSELATTHNTALAGIRRRIAAEGVTPHAGTVPPSPTDAGIGIAGSTIIIGETPLKAMDAQTLIERAVHAGHQPGTAPPTIPPVAVRVPMPEGPFWQDTTSGSVFAATNQPNTGCREITAAEYLGAVWGINVRDLPTEIIDQLTERERAHLAEQLLPEDAA